MSMTSVLAVTAAALIGVLLYVGRVVVAVLGEFSGTMSGIESHLRRLADGPEASVSERIRDLEDAVDRLPKRWEDIKREASAAESRARHHVSRAREELEERGFAHPGLETMAEELQLVDGNGGGGEGLHAMPTEVAEAPRQFVPEPEPDDWEQAALDYKYGRR